MMKILLGILFGLSILGISQSYSEALLTISTDKTFYDDGELIIISGTADPNLVEERFLAGIPEPQIIHPPVTVQIFGSAGGLIEIAQIEIEQDGFFFHEILAFGPQWQDPGLYTVKASHGKNLVETQFWFKFDGGPIPEPESIEQLTQETETKLPEWIRNIFIWYAEDLIEENELINALQFLIKEGIIKV